MQHSTWTQKIFIYCPGLKIVMMMTMLMLMSTSCTPGFHMQQAHQVIVACVFTPQVFEPQGAIDMALKLLGDGKDIKAVTDRLLNEAIRERKCKDNCTIILLQFVSNSQPLG
jgi:hypothetical protein